MSKLGYATKYLVVLAALLASACAEPRLGKNLVIVLPDENGKVGAVTVNDGTNAVLLDSALAAARVTSGNKVESVAVTNDDVDGIFSAATLLSALTAFDFTALQPRSAFLDLRNPFSSPIDTGPPPTTPDTHVGPGVASPISHAEWHSARLD